MRRRLRTWHVPENTTPSKRPRTVEPEHLPSRSPGDQLFLATEARVWALRRWSTGKLSSQDVCTLAWSLREACGHGLSDLSLPPPDERTNTGKYEAHIQNALLLKQFAEENLYVAKIPFSFPKSGRVPGLMFTFGDRSVEVSVVSQRTWQNSTPPLVKPRLSWTIHSCCRTNGCLPFVEKTLTISNRPLTCTLTGRGHAE